MMVTYIAVLELQASLGFVSLGPGVEVDHNQASGKMSQNVEIDEAAIEGYPEIVEVLLKHGARKDLKNWQGRTPLKVAEKYQIREFTKVVALLKQN